MFFIYNRPPFSQAGRRGFESRLRSNIFNKLRAKADSCYSICTPIHPQASNLLSVTGHSETRLARNSLHAWFAAGHPVRRMPAEAHVFGILSRSVWRIRLHHGARARSVACNLGLTCVQLIAELPFFLLNVGVLSVSVDLPLSLVYLSVAKMGNGIDLFGF